MSDQELQELENMAADAAELSDDELEDVAGGGANNCDCTINNCDPDAPSDPSVEPGVNNGCSEM